MANTMASMQEAPPLVAKPDYSSYVEYLEARGWRREQLTLDEINTTLVTTQDVFANTTDWVITITCPAGQKISIMGTQQVPRGADARTAHALRLRLANSADTEIPLQTKIRITKEKTSEAVVQLARVFYADVNLTKDSTATPRFKTDLEWYRFKQGVELNGQQLMRIYSVNSTTLVDDAHTKFALDLDLWTREE